MSLERACRVDEIAEDEGLAVTVGGVDIAVARCGEEVFAVRNECTHQSVPLTDGEVEDCEIECFLHGSTFDLRTGKAMCLPATEPVATFPVEVRDGEVYVDPTTTLNGAR